LIAKHPQPKQSLLAVARRNEYNSDSKTDTSKNAKLQTCGISSNGWQLQQQQQQRQQQQQQRQAATAAASNSSGSSNSGSKSSGSGSGNITICKQQPAAGKDIRNNHSNDGNS